jgi:hypothetical protein
MGDIFLFTATEVVANTPSARIRALRASLQDAEPFAAMAAVLLRAPLILLLQDAPSLA